MVKKFSLLKKTNCILGTKFKIKNLKGLFNFI